MDDPVPPSNTASPAARLRRHEIELLEDVVASLAQRHDGAVPATDIYRLVFAEYAELRRGATVLDHLVALTANRVSDRLRKQFDGPGS